MNSKSYESGRKAALERLAEASNMTRATWQRTGEIVAQRTRPTARTRTEFMRGWMSVFSQ